MIDENKLIDELKQSGLILDNERGNAIVDLINNQPKIGEWIPCRKRLPEKGETVIACTLNGTFAGQYHEEGWYRENMFFYDSEILDKCFNEKEKEIIAKSNKKDHDFTRIYTLKIAYIKMLDFDGKYSLVDIDTTQLKNWSTNENKDYFVSVVENKNL